jgi:hypothetical protein
MAPAPRVSGLVAPPTRVGGRRQLGWDVRGDRPTVFRAERGVVGQRVAALDAVAHVCSRLPMLCACATGPRPVRDLLVSHPRLDEDAMRVE